MSAIPQKLRLARLEGLFTGAGFLEKRGRFLTDADCGFVSGPVDLVCCRSSGTIVETCVGSCLQHTVGASDTAEEVIDCSGLFATPGLIDPHTHTVFAGSRANEYFRRWRGESYASIAESGGGIFASASATAATADQEITELLIARLKIALAQGTTLVEVKSGYGLTIDDEIRLLRIIASVRGIPDLPRLQSTFLPLHKRDSRSATAQVQEAIQGLKNICSDKLATGVDAFIEEGFFTFAEVRPFLRAAHSQGLRINAHIDQLTCSREVASAVDEGAQSLDHLELVDEIGIAALAANQTVACLLPTAAFFLGTPYANARRLIRAGVRIALGSDFNPGTAPWPSLSLAMLLAAAQLHMSSVEILCAVTFNAASALGLEAAIGALLPHFKADIAIWPCSQQSPRSPIEHWERVIVESIRPRMVVIGSHVMTGTKSKCESDYIDIRGSADSKKKYSDRSFINSGKL